MRAYFLFIFIFLIGFFVDAQEWYKSKVIIVENTIMVPVNASEIISNTLIDDERQKYDEEKKLKLFLAQQARQLSVEILSAEIYGYKFTYTPSDALRGVQEKWNLEPIAKVPLDDENLILMKSQLDQQIYTAIYRYNLTRSQVRRLEAWEVADIHPSSGKGFSSLDGHSVLESKLLSINDAIRDGVRKRLQLEIPNKPRVVTGIVKLTATPFFLQNGNYYNSTVEIDIRTDSIETYEQF